MNVLRTLPSPTTRLITISSSGLTNESYKSLPILLKPLYGAVIAAPHRDKLGSERLIHHVAGWTWKEHEPIEEILAPGWEKTEGLPAPGTLKRMLILRPALLTDGECQADSGKLKVRKGKLVPPYRVSERELGGYTISRKDVAHFISDAVLNRWNEYEGKVVNVGY
jgi:hypothetical protein